MGQADNDKPIALTIRRKFLILELRKRIKRDHREAPLKLWSAAWRRAVYAGLKQHDAGITPKHLQKWVDTHAWITDDSLQVPGMLRYWDVDADEVTIEGLACDSYPFGKEGSGPPSVPPPGQKSQPKVAVVVTSTSSTKATVSGSGSGSGGFSIQPPQALISSDGFPVRTFPTPFPYRRFDPIAINPPNKGDSKAGQSGLPQTKTQTVTEPAPSAVDMQQTEEIKVKEEEQQPVNLGSQQSSLVKTPIPGPSVSASSAQEPRQNSVDMQQTEEVIEIIVETVKREVQESVNPGSQQEQHGSLEKTPIPGPSVSAPSAPVTEVEQQKLNLGFVQEKPKIITQTVVCPPSTILPIIPQTSTLSPQIARVTIPQSAIRPQTAPPIIPQTQTPASCPPNTPTLRPLTKIASTIPQKSNPTSSSPRIPASSVQMTPEYGQSFMPTGGPIPYTPPYGYPYNLQQYGPPFMPCGFENSTLIQYNSFGYPLPYPYPSHYMQMQPQPQPSQNEQSGDRSQSPVLQNLLPELPGFSALLSKRLMRTIPAPGTVERKVVSQNRINAIKRKQQQIHDEIPIKKERVNDENRGNEENDSDEDADDGNNFGFYGS